MRIDWHRKPRGSFRKYKTAYGCATQPRLFIKFRRDLEGKPKKWQIIRLAVWSKSLKSGVLFVCGIKYPIIESFWVRPPVKNGSVQDSHKRFWQKKLISIRII